MPIECYDIVKNYIPTWKCISFHFIIYIILIYKIEEKSALSGNRTRAARVAGEHSTTEPTMLTCSLHRKLKDNFLNYRSFLKKQKDVYWYLWKLQLLISVLDFDREPIDNVLFMTSCVKKSFTKQFFTIMTMMSSLHWVTYLLVGWDVITSLGVSK